MVNVKRMTSKEKRKKDAIWHEKILKRDNYRCAICKKRAVDSHHIIKRTYLWTRWDLSNGVSLCRTCHSSIELDKNKEKIFINTIVGIKRYEDLKEKAGK